MAKVDFGGVVKDVCLAYLPEIRVGDYTIVHVGFAIQKLDEASALETLAMFNSLGLLDGEFREPGLGEPGLGEPGLGEPGLGEPELGKGELGKAAL